ncbi:MAG: glycosyltransferase family A protein [Armatimonadota bacterium]
MYTYPSPNRGPSCARNCALERIRGKYVQFIDADDVIAENKIEQQVAELSKIDDLALRLEAYKRLKRIIHRGQQT